MSHHTIITTQNTYFIAHNGEGIIHWGYLTTGRSLHSGQPNLEQFSDKSEFLNRVTELGGTVDLALLEQMENPPSPPSL